MPVNQRRTSWSTALDPRHLQTLAFRYAAAIGTIAVVTLIYRRMPLNHTTVALTFLLVVLGVAGK